MSLSWGLTAPNEKLWDELLPQRNTGKAAPNPHSVPGLQTSLQKCLLQAHTFTQSWLDPRRTQIAIFTHFALKFLCGVKAKQMNCSFVLPNVVPCVWDWGAHEASPSHPHILGLCISPLEDMLREELAQQHQHHWMSHRLGTATAPTQCPSTTLAFPFVLLPPSRSWWPFLLQKARKAWGMLLLFLLIWEPSTKAVPKQLGCKLMIRQ